MLERYVVIKSPIQGKNLKNKSLGYKDASWLYLETWLLGDQAPLDDME